MRPRFFFFLLAAASCAWCGPFTSGRDLPATLTPAASPEPRIHGPSVFGARPGSPFLYRIAATGERPMQYSVTGLPEGLSLDGHTGQISGRVGARGEFPIQLQARNARGSASKKLRIVIGDQIALTPPMGWNSWNCWAGSVDQEKVLKSARAMVSARLIDHGWTYVNIDDAWQGPRGAPFGGLQGNSKFPDMKKLCDEIHAMGLKAGIYSTPWITSYARYPGGSSDNPEGAWSKALASDKQHRHGKYSFARNDARQWADWGFDYLKYDWSPNDVEHTSEMSNGPAREWTRHRLQPVQLGPLRARGRLGETGELLADHGRHLGPLARKLRRLAIRGFRDRLHPGPVGALRRPWPLERSRYACRRSRRLGTGPAPEQAERR